MKKVISFIIIVFVFQCPLFAQKDSPKRLIEKLIVSIDSAVCLNWELTIGKEFVVFKYKDSLPLKNSSVHLALSSDIVFCDSILYSEKIILRFQRSIMENEINLIKDHNRSIESIAKRYVMQKNNIMCYDIYDFVNLDSTYNFILQQYKIYPNINSKKSGVFLYQERKKSYCEPISDKYYESRNYLLSLLTKFLNKNLSLHLDHLEVLYCKDLNDVINSELIKDEW
jgi:hypothetical protein